MFSAHVQEFLLILKKHPYFKCMRKPARLTIMFPGAGDGLLAASWWCPPETVLRGLREWTSDLRASGLLLAALWVK